MWNEFGTDPMDYLRILCWTGNPYLLGWNLSCICFWRINQDNFRLRHAHQNFHPNISKKSIIEIIFRSLQIASGSPFMKTRSFVLTSNVLWQWYFKKLILKLPQNRLFQKSVCRKIKRVHNASNNTLISKIV